MLEGVFGGGYAANSDGKATIGRFYGHLDASFFTGRLVNIISADNLNTAVLSSNIIRKDRDFTMKADSKLNMHSDPCDKNFDCTTLLKSTTFMRYMSAEGAPSADIVSAKKQIFEGEFNPFVGKWNINNQNEKKNILQPHDVLFAWLNKVACDKCDDQTANEFAILPSNYGVFHDYFRD